MTSGTKSSYSLRRFSSSSDSEFINALKLYADHTPPAVRTSTNEITYWLDKAKSYYPCELFVFGFYSNKNLVGFSEMVYLPSCMTLVVDYLVIDPKFRSINVIFEFMEHVKTYSAGLGLDIRYVVTEIGKYGSMEPPENSKKLVRLLKFAGFRIAKALYFQPCLGEKNSESQMESILMVYVYGDSDGDREHSFISKNTYMHIVESIYFEHYFRWYLPHLKDMEGYRKGLEILLNKVSVSIKGDNIELNGRHVLLEPGNSETVYREKNITALVGVGLLIVMAIVVGLVMLANQMGLPTELTLIVYVVVFVSFVGAIASYKESPTAIFDSAISTLEKIFHIRK